MTWGYADLLYDINPAATLDDLREAVARLEEIGRTARRVFGGTHPNTAAIEYSLKVSRKMLRASETPPPAGTR